MARKRKSSLTLEEQLANVTAEIEEAETNLKELKNTKKDLEEQIKMDRLVELDELISASGKSIDEVRELLNA